MPLHFWNDDTQSLMAVNDVSSLSSRNSLIARRERRYYGSTAFAENKSQVDFDSNDNIVNNNDKNSNDNGNDDNDDLSMKRETHRASETRC